MTGQSYSKGKLLTRAGVRPALAPLKNKPDK
jgi:hypothetical protein